MGRKRKNNKHLPKRWKLDRGTYYYIVPPGQEDQWDGKKWFRLGKTEAEAYRTWADRVEQRDSMQTMADLFDRYLMEHTPTCRPKTQAHHHRAIGNLRKVFGHISPLDFQSAWAFRYYDERKQDGKHAADTDIKTLSHVFTKAIEWGVIQNSQHPMRGLKIKQGSQPRDRYVEDWELSEALAVADDMLVLYLAFKLITGMDKSTILSIQLFDIKEDGIEAGRLKTKGRRRLYEWTPALRECVRQIKALPRPVSSVWLFCTRQGQPFINADGYTSAFDSKWRRFMAKALNQTGLENRFTEHDLRAKAASDSDSLEFAQALLGHSDPSITKRVYRRKLERVKTRDVNIERIKRK